MSLSLPSFGLSNEQLEFRDTLRRFVEEHVPRSEVRRVMESEHGLAPALWKAACEGIGLPAIAIPESAGGQGFGLVELGIAAAEIGRALAPVPLLATAGLAARAVDAAARVAGVAREHEREAWLAPIAAGSVATLAWIETSGADSLEAIRTVCRSEGRSGERVGGGRSGERVRISGVKRFVLDAVAAERLFVIARAEGSRGLQGLGLFVVEASAPGVELEPVESLDPTRRLARVRFDQAPAHAVGSRDEAGPALARALDEATAILGAEMIGGMEKVLESAVEYARSRKQFGRPIGSFQAIKHKCADMLIDFEGARTAVHAAIEALEDDDPEAVLLAAVAKAHAGPAFVRMATENLQIHGGVGYTWEYDAHLYFRRAHSSSILLGDAVWHRERLARWLATEATGTFVRDGDRPAGRDSEERTT